MTIRLVSSASNMRFSARWKGPQVAAGLLLFMGVLTSAFVFALVFSIELSSAIEALLWAAGLSPAVAGLVLLSFPRPHLLVLNPKGLSYKPARRKTRRIPLEELETIRVSTHTAPWVALISNRALVRCVMKRDEQATWLAAAMLHFLARAQALADGPYR